MSEMSKARLYDSPHVTREVLKLVIKGSNTQKKLAEGLGCAERTVYNKVHDPKVLGFLEREDGRYVITDKQDLMKLFQLDDRAVLKKRFKQMPGVDEINDELVGGSLSFTRVGRIVSYYTGSEAIDEDAFNTYGRIYSQWFDYLGMGYASNQKLSRDKPPNYSKPKASQRNQSGVSYPKVSPNKVFEALHAINEGVSTKSELADRFDVADRQAGKILRSCYLLGLAADKDRVQLTDLGREVLDASENDRKDLIRGELLELEIVKSYIEIAPEEPFKNKDIVRNIGKELGKNWSEGTIETKAKRLYSWLVFSDLFKEIKNGTLVPKPTPNSNGLRSIEDYA